ncbi:hypothetical protein BX600DRAFT_429286 [Xylariales sp. PMI_506]|nr:hypothetical protein BX600DRAFT_429286 [Xylariales sp. PMI_506]
MAAVNIVRSHHLALIIFYLLSIPPTSIPGVLVLSRGEEGKKEIQLPLVLGTSDPATTPVDADVQRALLCDFITLHLGGLVPGAYGQADGSEGKQTTLLSSCSLCAAFTCVGAWRKDGEMERERWTVFYTYTMGRLTPTAGLVGTIRIVYLNCGSARSLVLS